MARNLPRTSLTALLILLAFSRINAQFKDDRATVNITFVVEMKYMAAEGKFNPATDTVYLAGDTNTWVKDTVLTRIDTSLRYQSAFPLTQGLVYQYKFRINHDSARTEFPAGPDRFYRIPDTAQTLLHYFNDINPDMVAMTFRCNMKYQIQAYHFLPNFNFLDVAGNFNNGGDWDILYKKESDSIYSMTRFFDTTYLDSTLSFKFRMRGDSVMTELAGKPDRIYTLHDTAGGNPNMFYCWYDDKDPSVPAPPWVYNVSIQGEMIDSTILTGMYTYENVNGVPEGPSRYQWYLADDSLGISRSPIDSAWKINYRLDSLDIGKYIVFEVTPVTRDSVSGNPVSVVSLVRVVGVGINEKQAGIFKVYPNPAENWVNIRGSVPISSVEIFDRIGIKRKEFRDLAGKEITLEINDLLPGIYFLRINGSGVATLAIRY